MNLPAPIRQKRPPKVKRITLAQAKVAAQSIGMEVVKIDNLLDHARIGKFIEGLGATQISRSVLLVARGQIDDKLKMIEGYIAQSDGDLPLIAELLKLHKGYVELKIRNEQSQLKAAKEEKNETPGGAPLVMAFPPGTAISTTITSPELKNVTPQDEKPQ